MEHIVIRSTGIYHPAHKVDNSYYVRRYLSKGNDIRPLLKATGRQTRYLSDNMEENSLTMAVQASKAALRSAALKGSDIDLLLFSSCTPEYLSPTNALQIHKQIGGRSDSIAYDMNANCVGMVIAIDQASRFMLSSANCRRALVVGSEQMHRFSQEDDEVTMSNFGDAACAVVLEKSCKDKPAGFMDSLYFINSSNSHNMTFPQVGLSHIYDSSIDENKKRIFWPGGPGDKSDEMAAHLITDLLARHNLSPRDVSYYFLSQVSLKNLQNIAARLNTGMYKIPFVGDQYGYTGTTSPFLAFHHTAEQGKIKSDDILIFWSIGTGLETCALLWKY